jgi:fermentation-respiration switch protein FrsA (DUF1100 family)
MTGAREFLFGYDSGVPLELAVGVAIEGRGASESRLSYLSSGPVRVPALIARPHRRPNGAALLIQHGGGESKDDPLVRLLMRRWSAAGFVCLAIDAPGHGERSVSKSTAVRRGFFEYLRSRVQNVLDLRRALDILETEPSVDPGRIGYWGVSMGGSVGVMLMASDPRVRAGCLCLAGARSRRAWPFANGEAADFAAANIDPMALAPAIGARQVLMLNGSEDPTVPRDDALRLYQALPGPKEQRWFKTAHRVTPTMLRASGEFFERALAP